jgi:hypothetical protein
MREGDNGLIHGNGGGGGEGEIVKLANKRRSAGKALEVCRKK